MSVLTESGGSSDSWTPTPKYSPRNSRMHISIQNSYNQLLGSLLRTKCKALRAHTKPNDIIASSYPNGVSFSWRDTIRITYETIQKSRREALITIDVTLLSSVLEASVEAMVPFWGVETGMGGMLNFACILGRQMGKDREKEWDRYMDALTSKKSTSTTDTKRFRLLQSFHLVPENWLGRRSCRGTPIRYFLIGTSGKLLNPPDRLHFGTAGVSPLAADNQNHANMK